METSVYNNFYISLFAERSKQRFCDLHLRGEDCHVIVSGKWKRLHPGGRFTLQLVCHSKWTSSSHHQAAVCRHIGRCLCAV